MLVLFKENYECVIKNTTTLRIGEMLCDLLNLDIQRLEKMEKELVSLLHSIYVLAVYNKELQYGTVSHYRKILKEKLEQMGPYKKELLKLPFYKYTGEIENGFHLLMQFADGINSQIKNQPPQTLIPDAKITYDLDLYDSAVEKITLPINTVFKCYQFFRPMVDLCLLYDSASAEEKPIRRLREYGLDKFNEQAGKAVKYAHSADTAPLSLIYEIVEDKGGLSLVQCFDFATLPQFIYYEFTKMIGLNLVVRHCKYCGRYFVIYSERILEYCGSIPHGESKPCSIIGPARLYGQKVKSDPILEIYTRAYKKYVARKRSGKISPEEFTAWTKKARNLRDQAYKENTSQKEFTEWMR